MVTVFLIEEEILPRFRKGDGGNPIKLGLNCYIGLARDFRNTINIV